jgi:hypothetical protein
MAMEYRPVSGRPVTLGQRYPGLRLSGTLPRELSPVLDPMTPEAGP